MANTLGIIGVGQLAHYFVAGLRRGGDGRTILLSPRRPETAQALADAHDCEIVMDNQAMVDRCDIVVLATRPEQTVDTCRALTFRPDQLVLSVAASVRVADIAAVADGATVVRCLPIFSAEVGVGPVPLYPHDDRAEALLGTLGTVVGFASEAEFSTATVMGCTFVWQIRMIGEIAAFMERAGLSAADARAMALSTVEAAAAVGIRKPELDLLATARAIAKPDTFSRMGEEVMEERGAFDALVAACETIDDAFGAR